MSDKNWSGDVPSNTPAGANTGIAVNAGDKITILASGWIKYGKEEYALATPYGRIKKELQTKDTAVLMARFSESGKSYPVGHGKYQWAAPENGTVSLFVADTAEGYSDNTGSFKAELYV